MSRRRTRHPSRAPRGGSSVPRAATGEYGVLIGRESAPIAVSAGMLRAAESAGIAGSAPRDFVNFTCNDNMRICGYTTMIYDDVINFM